jgi:hypothetical protein
VPLPFFGRSLRRSENAEGPIGWHRERSVSACLNRADFVAEHRTCWIVAPEYNQQGATMKNLRTLALALTLALTTGVAMAQSVGNSGNPARADTTDPNSAPRMGTQGTQPQTSGRSLDAAGKANTSDPNSAMSGGTDASGKPVNPQANPRQR